MSIAAENPKTDAIIQCLRAQREEALDTVAILRGEIAGMQQEIESLKSLNAALAEQVAIHHKP